MNLRFIFISKKKKSSFLALFTEKAKSMSRAWLTQHGPLPRERTVEWGGSQQCSWGPREGANLAGPALLVGGQDSQGR